MSEYPREVRSSRIKCVACNAPATETTEDEFRCVECGSTVIARKQQPPLTISVSTPVEGIEVLKTVEDLDSSSSRITFTLRSDRNHPVRVQVFDELPSDIESEDIEFGAETVWSYRPEGLSGEMAVPPNGEVEVHYTLPSSINELCAESAVNAGDTVVSIDRPDVQLRANGGSYDEHHESENVNGESTRRLSFDGAVDWDRDDPEQFNPDVEALSPDRIESDADGDRRLPGIGIILTDEWSDSVFRTLIRARRRGNIVFVINRGWADQEYLEVASQLGATIIQSSPSWSLTECRNAIIEASQNLSLPGVIVQSDLSAPIDYARSTRDQADSSYDIDAVLENESSDEQGFKLLSAIPAYNEAATIGDVVKQASLYSDWILVIDDGSDDETARLAEEAGAEVIRHKQNLGYGAALKTAFREAKDRSADRLVVLDGDGQHDPTDIPSLTATMDREDADIVIGSRLIEGSDVSIPRYRKFGITVISVMLNLSIGVLRPSKFIKDTQSGYRIYNRDAIEVLADEAAISDDMDASVDILYHAFNDGLIVEEVGTKVKYDVENPNSQNPLLHGYRIVSSIINTVERERPITTVGLPGLLILSAGVGLGYSLVSAGLPGGGFALGMGVISIFMIVLGFASTVAAAVLHAFNLNRPLLRS